MDHAIQLDPEHPSHEICASERLKDDDFSKELFQKSFSGPLKLLDFGANQSEVIRVITFLGKGTIALANCG